MTLIHDMYLHFMYIITHATLLHAYIVSIYLMGNVVKLNYKKKMWHNRVKISIKVLKKEHLVKNYILSLFKKYRLTTKIC